MKKQTFGKAGEQTSYNQFRVARNGNKGVLQIKIAYQKRCTCIRAAHPQFARQPEN
jgi:hypothetical protein